MVRDRRRERTADGAGQAKSERTADDFSFLKKVYEFIIRLKARFNSKEKFVDSKT